MNSCKRTPCVILISTGFEVKLVLYDGKVLTTQGKKVHVVSIPLNSVFDTQSIDYKENILPSIATKPF